ncbi:MAG: hypothetical protein CML05_15240 [Pseudozobellia sp.]|nr:hypothetical protein [Pseudozobellia sp.]|tara:strand:- start:160493 stop:162256 length:1764 start_codon:yes stop_codon:yes gene_type:complete
MNKTININLANMLFHMDEEAYNKMQRYLESVKRSFANTPGSEEILADIEARIAELFSEKLENERQVITVKEVDQVIAIMGQPEDYMVDEDMFEDEPISGKQKAPKRAKKFYRDTDHKYIAGVSSGLGHYFNIDPLWVRLIWIVLTIGSTGAFIVIYALLWLLIPEAKTTSQKLDMRGEDVNISNIERKVKEGFDDVAHKIKSVDYEGVTKKVKNGGKSFFETLGDIIMFFFKIIGKFIGIILVVVGAATIIGMFIGMLTMGTLDWINLPGVDGVLNNLTVAPVWVFSILLFFAIGIPFFFLMYLGLKILVNNLKSIGNIAKFSLLGLWIICIISLIVLGVREAASHAFTGSIKEDYSLTIDQQTDTLNLQLVSSEYYDDGEYVRMNDMILVYDQDGSPMLQSEDVRFNIKRSNDSVARITVKKEANGPSFDQARSTAEKIDYKFEQKGETLMLDTYLTTNDQSKFNDQEVKVNLYLPTGQYMKYAPSNTRNWTIRADRDTNIDDAEDYLWMMGEDGQLKCQNCPSQTDDENGENRIKINENGIDININESNGESFKMKIDNNGVQIKAKDQKDSLDINIDGSEESPQ